jgi:hypothetical protein
MPARKRSRSPLDERFRMTIRTMWTMPLEVQRAAAACLTMAAALILGIVAESRSPPVPPLAPDSTAMPGTTPCIASRPRDRGAVEAIDDSLHSAFAGAVTGCMHGMHDAMDRALSATGSADALFAAAMISHHQGAIDMARQLLLYGRDPQLRAFALNVIAEQQAEIDMLVSWDVHHRPASNAGTAVRPSGAPISSDRAAPEVHTER